MMTELGKVKTVEVDDMIYEGTDDACHVVCEVELVKDDPTEDRIISALDDDGDSVEVGRFASSCLIASAREVADGDPSFWEDS